MTDPGPVVFDVPVQCLVTVEGGRVTRIAFLPCESYAGYFGPGTSVWEAAEGADIDAARGALENNAWEPLYNLPDGIEWLG